MCCRLRNASGSKEGGSVRDGTCSARALKLSGLEMDGTGMDPGYKACSLCTHTCYNEHGYEAVKTPADRIPRHPCFLKTAVDVLKTWMVSASWTSNKLQLYSSVFSVVEVLSQASCSLGITSPNFV